MAEGTTMMTQTLFQVFVPTFAVMIGILLNRTDASRIDGRISSLENRLDGRITALESRLHADMMQVIGKLTELEVRVARLEEEQ